MWRWGWHTGTITDIIDPRLLIESFLMESSWLPGNFNRLTIETVIHVEFSLHVRLSASRGQAAWDLVSMKALYCGIKALYWWFDESVKALHWRRTSDTRNKTQHGKWPLPNRRLSNRPLPNLLTATRKSEVSEELLKNEEGLRRT